MKPPLPLAVYKLLFIPMNTSVMKIVIATGIDTAVVLLVRPL